MIKRTLSLVLLLGLPLAASAQDLETHPGYVDLSALEAAMVGHATAHLDFDHAALASFLNAAGTADPQITALVDSIAEVRIRAFDLDTAQIEEVRSRLADAADQLRGAGWGTLASVHDDEDNVWVFMKSDGTHVVGLVAMYGDDDGAGFVHVMGEIDAAQVMAAVMQHSQDLRQLLTTVKGEAGEP